MKKIVLTMFAIAALLGCENDTPSGPATPQDKAITFGNVTTRAVTSAADINEFPVWACIAGPEGYVSLLDGERVYRTTDGAWDYDNTRYWVDDSHFFFLGLYSDQPINSFEEVKYDGNLVGYTLQVETPDAANLDIVAALNHTYTGDELFQTALTDPNIAAPMVAMEFSHLMTKVNLKITQDFDKSPDFDYYVSKVTISGVKSRGTIVAIPYGNQFLNSCYFEDDAPTKTFEKSFSTPVRLRNPDASDKKVVLTTFGDDGLLLLPQEIVATSIRIRVDYYYDVDSSDEDMGVARYVETYIPASNIWESNKAITYTLAISEQNDIKFLAPKIESWGSPQTGGTIIIK